MRGSAGASVLSAQPLTRTSKDDVPAASPNRRSVLARRCGRGCSRPASRAAARSAEEHRNPSVPRQRSGGALVDLRRRIAATRWPDRETVDDQSQGIQLAKLKPLVRVLGHRLRLAQGGSEAQRPAAVHDHDRRPRHPLHPRPLASSERPAADHDARLAGLGVRAAQDRRPAHRSHGSWRARGGRLRPRSALDARLRLLRQADGHRLGPRPHRASLGGADEAPRLHPLRRPGRRLGLPRLQRDGAPGAGGPARHPHQLAGDGAARGGHGARRRRARAGGTLREGTRDVRRSSPRPPKRATGPTPR